LHLFATNWTVLELFAAGGAKGVPTGVDLGTLVNVLADGTHRVVLEKLG